jgi:hypothetical protein
MTALLLKRDNSPWIWKKIKYYKSNWRKNNQINNKIMKILKIIMIRVAKTIILI